MKEIAERIKGLRGESGLSQQQLAVLVGVHESTVRRSEAAERLVARAVEAMVESGKIKARESNGAPKE